MRKNNWLLLIGTVILGLQLFGVYHFGTARVIDQADSKEKTIMVLNQSWHVRFSNPIQEKDITEEKIKVWDEEGGEVPVSYTISSDRTKLRIILPERESKKAPRARDYTVSIKGVKSDWGIPLIGGGKLRYTVQPTLPTFQSEAQLKEYLPAEKESGIRWFSFSSGSKSSEQADMKGSAAGEIAISETNTQVAGIDEGDVVKTDGSYIYSISGQNIMITGAKPANNIALASTISPGEDYYPFELFLHGNRLVIIGESSLPAKIAKQDKKAGHYTQVLIYDITNKQKPKEIKRIGVEGSYQTARKKGSYVYIIANQYPVWSHFNERPGNLLPRIFDTEEGVYAQQLDKMQYIPGSKEENIMHTMAIHVGDGSLPYEVNSLLGGSETIYMSEDNLFVAATKYDAEDEEDISNLSTEVYKFSVAKTAITFHSVGNVEGGILNQFSMDEYEGHFRIATTQEDFSGKRQSSNHLFILDKNMETVGKVGDLAKGERIYSVRFMGDKAYIVTFKQVDPLFVIDTGNPGKPKVLGELKIPGYSTYLHPYDENHLIGYGYDTKVQQNLNGEEIVSQEGMKISLFDVSDLARPKEKAAVVIGSGGTYSPLLYDHKALFQYREKHLFGFPITVYDKNQQGGMTNSFQGVHLYEITPQTGIVLKAKLPGKEEIQRLVRIDEVLYTVSPSELKAFNLNTNKAISTVSFTPFNSH
ncbi:MAG: beta-propeller domain-containing protein [Bacillus sp. (in: firmicutes)]